MLKNKQHQIALLSFSVGLIIAIVIFSAPPLRLVLVDLEHSGYVGVFITGLLYGMNLTAATATAIFFDLPDRLNPWIAAIIGGMGALAYDLTVFTIFRKNSHARWIEELKHHLPGRSHKLPSWLLAVFGGLIIASPLPDELGIGFLGSSSIRPSRFMMISFLANAGGIFLLQTLHHG